MLSDAGSMFIDSNDGELMALADLGLDVPREGQFLVDGLPPESSLSQPQSGVEPRAVQSKGD